MLNIGFFKGQPTDYVIKYVAGKVRREGQGLAFYYLKHNTQIVAIPTSSTDSSFVFNEVTKTFQAVVLQGQFTYRIQNPGQAATLLNFTIDPARRSYTTNDPERLAQRIANIIQMEARVEIQKRSLEETLHDFQTIAVAALSRIQEKASLKSMGVELMSLYVQSAKPIPEVAKALEAEQRESLLRRADEAIYARRAAAVEEERKIKENQLATDITLEERRKELISLQGANVRQEAQDHAKAIELEMGAYRSQDPKTLLALALKDIGTNAGKVGSLTITSEILASLLNGSK
ncbi:MAG: SPFH domain-containing protein [Elusimicrobia bacterium]|nr:SPFH domain-containing protein [Elusimicrobiota bacterium]